MIIGTLYIMKMFPFHSLVASVWVVCVLIYLILDKQHPDYLGMDSSVHTVLPANMAASDGVGMELN